MKRSFLYAVAVAAILAISSNAETKLFINQVNGISSGASPENVSQITFSEDEQQMLVETADGEVTVFPVDDVSDLTFDDIDAVQITFADEDVKIVNPFAFEGVDITKEGAHVIVNSTCTDEIEYHLSGQTLNGSFKVYQTDKSIVKLEGVSLTNPQGAAINIQGKKLTLSISEGTENYLCDGLTYNTPDGEKEKGTIYSKGKMEIKGKGMLIVDGHNKHAICTDGDLTVSNGTVKVLSAASDAIHCSEDFVMDGGTLCLSADGDGIDGDADVVNINGGSIEIEVTKDTSKGIKTDGAINIAGGEIRIDAKGGVVVTDGDPSYCTAIKSDADVAISGGSIAITHSGAAGKGISADGNINISDGTLSIITTGNGATYTNALGAVDSYSAACIKSDADISITGGTVSVSSSGTAGKGISADGALTIGGIDGVEPTINATTTGKKFLVSGYGMSADYANPKAIKSEGNLTVNSGKIIVNTANDGGEGLESKAILTINGGAVEAVTYDDAINAATNITINGGYVYCYSSGNDAIDSNGTLTITGGVVIASGTSQPEGSFDCDNNTFKITGGILIGTGGDTSTPTASVCTQRSVLYSLRNATKGLLFRVETSSGEEVITYALPRTYSNCKVFFSSPDLTSGTTYVIKTGGAVTGGEEFNGYTLGGTYSGGTQSATFTCSSMVTNIGNSGGRP